MPRLILGNLDCEERFPRPDGAPPARVSDAALRRISALATLLRAFADEGDLLWTARPVEPARMPDVPGLPRPRLVSGAIGDPGFAGEVFPWGGTDETAARVNHRGFGLELAERCGEALPGAKLLLSLWALERHLEAGGAAAAPGERWVLKAPWSAAGRGRVFGRGRALGEPEERAAERILIRDGSMLFEPWMERTEDYGAIGTVSADGPVDLAAHRLLVDDRGRFAGIGTPAPEDVIEPLVDAGRRAGEALAAAGYRGPFGVDAFRHRAPDGGLRLHRFAEINARLTFGHLARRLAERTAPDAGPIAFHVGRGAPPPGSIPLLLPGEDDPTSAWLERRGWSAASFTE